MVRDQPVKTLGVAAAVRLDAIQAATSDAIRLHLTNAAGAGAVQLLESLLPALERAAGGATSCIYLPDRGPLARYVPSGDRTPASVYRRRLPNALSRLFECTFLASRLSGETPLLVLGDLPLRCDAPQVVFVQNAHLLDASSTNSWVNAVRFAVSRAVFRRNLRCAGAFIVQTAVMRDRLEAAYPAVRGRVHVVAQPVPRWLLDSGLVRKGRAARRDGKLRLVFPAASYPHKNHGLLSRIPPSRGVDWPVERLALTIDAALHPAPDLPWIDCVGFLTPEGMIEEYGSADALLFLSLEESYGFPLVEAMFLGVPIVCPDLPYARALCGDEALYFDPRDVGSLEATVRDLHRRLASGWWPDWTGRMARIPGSWEEVAARMLAIVADTARAWQDARRGEVPDQ
jgi:glycosyltransferase involved in cell wall biosynthesis